MRRLEEPRFTDPRVPDVPNPRTQHMLRRKTDVVRASQQAWHTNYAVQWVYAPVKATRTEADQAGTMFLEQARNLPGVRRITADYDEETGNRSFLVHVRRGDIDAEYSVYDLKGAIYSRFPDTYLDVLVLDDQD